MYISPKCHRSWSERSLGEKVTDQIDNRSKGFWDKKFIGPSGQWSKKSQFKKVLSQKVNKIDAVKKSFRIKKVIGQKVRRPWGQKRGQQGHR